MTILDAVHGAYSAVQFCSYTVRRMQCDRSSWRQLFLVIAIRFLLITYLLYLTSFRFSFAPIPVYCTLYTTASPSVRLSLSPSVTLVDIVISDRI